jgi:hypothetical protein
MGLRPGFGFLPSHSLSLRPGVVPGAFTGLPGAREAG